MFRLDWVIVHIPSEWIGFVAVGMTRCLTRPGLIGLRGSCTSVCSSSGLMRYIPVARLMRNIQKGEF